MIIWWSALGLYFCQFLILKLQLRWCGLYFGRDLRCSAVLDTNYLTIIFNQFFSKCLLKIQLLPNINEKHLIWRFSKSRSELILYKLSYHDISAHLKSLLSTSIKQFYENVNLLFIHMSIVNNVNNVFISKNKRFLFCNSLSFMEKNHTVLLDINFTLHDILNLMVGCSFRDGN